MKNGKLVPNKKEADKLEAEIIAMRQDAETKKYLVEASPEAIDNMVKYIETTAPWKYSEAVGIVQVHADLTAAIEEAKIAKIKGIMLNNVALEAMNYFYSLGHGVGLQSATEYLAQVRPLADALLVAKTQLEEINKKEFELSALREGLAIADELSSTITEPTENADEAISNVSKTTKKSKITKL